VARQRAQAEAGAAAGELHRVVAAVGRARRECAAVRVVPGDGRRATHWVDASSTPSGLKAAAMVERGAGRKVQ